MARHFRDDVVYFVLSSPYLQLAKPSAAERYLNRHLAAAEECLTDLAAYPRVLLEPLEFFYQCLRSLGALDLEALFSEYTWRGVQALPGRFLGVLLDQSAFGRTTKLFTFMAATSA